MVTGRREARDRTEDPDLPLATDRREVKDRTEVPDRTEAPDLPMVTDLTEARDRTEAPDRTGEDITRFREEDTVKDLHTAQIKMEETAAEVPTRDVLRELAADLKALLARAEWVIRVLSVTAVLMRAAVALMAIVSAIREEMAHREINSNVREQAKALQQKLPERTWRNTGRKKNAVSARRRIISALRKTLSTRKRTM